MLARTEDFRRVERAALFTECDTRNVVLFPQKFADKYARPEVPHPAHTVLEILRPRLDELMPVDLSHYGLESLSSQRLDEDHPAREVVSYCARILGVPDFEMVEASGGVPRGVVEPRDPCLILLPRDFLRLSVPEQRFLCGRLLTRVAARTEILDPGRMSMSPCGTTPVVRLADLPGCGGEVSAAPLDDFSSKSTQVG